jgi:hypothetical protein
MKKVKKSIMNKKKFWYLVLVLLITVMVGVFFWFKNAGREIILAKKTHLLSCSKPKVISIDLYFGDANSDYLIPESRKVTLEEEDLKKKAKIIIEELIKGPKSNLFKTIPEGVVLRDITIKDNSTIIIDFSPELVSNHPGGSSAEIQTIYSIVNSILLNIPSLKEVKILVSGKTRETLKGHIDLRTPLGPNYSLLKKG